MQRTNRIYEAPSRLSQGLVVGLSVAVVAMAGWLAITITHSQSVASSAEGAPDVTANPLGDGSAASVAPDAPRPAARSVHFDWPEQFASATARPSAPPPVPAALPLTSTELPVARDLARSPWPAGAPGARDRSLPPRRPAGSAADAIVGIHAPPPPSRTPAAREAAAPTPRQAQRRQKPRVETEATSLASSPTKAGDPVAPGATEYGVPGLRGE